MRHPVRFARSADGVQLAWASEGDGPLVIKTAHWLSHLQHDWESPVWSHWLRFFTGHFRFVRYDDRGNGLSGPPQGPPSIERWLSDFETIVDAVQPTEPFILLGASQGAATAIAYAARHPERIAKLILYGGYSRGWEVRGDPETIKLFQAVAKVMKVAWGLEDPLFRQFITGRCIPGGSPEQVRWFNDLCARATCPDVAAEYLLARGKVDVSGLLTEIKVPTLIAHAAGDQVAPIDESKLMARQIPGARSIYFDSPNHVLLEAERAWQQFKSAVLEFVQDKEPIPDRLRATVAKLSPRERDIVELIAEAKSNRGIAEELGISEKTVRNHVSSIFQKLNVRTRAEAMLHWHEKR